MPCPSPEQLATLAEGGLDPSAVAHLERCEACRDVLRIVGRGAPSMADGSEPIAEGSGPAAAPRPAPGDMIGRYVVLRVVAQGGMGEVYLGYDPVLDRNLALKLVRADRSSPAQAERLAREAKVLAKLAHANVVRVFDAGTWRGIGYVVMEYLDGESVRAWTQTAKRTTAEIIRVFAGAARGVGAAHALGVVHRDIKPDNILVGSDGAGRIADFGLDFVTPGYRAPEVIAGATPDARSDQWSLCAALWEMFSGELPAPAQALAPVRAVPAATLRALRRGLDADPARRFASMDDLAAALVPRRSETRYVLAFAAVAAGSITAWTLLTGEAPAAACDREGRTAIADAAPLESAVFRQRFDLFGASAELRRGAFERELASYKTRLGANAVAACRARSVDAAAAALQRDCNAARRRELTALAVALQAADRTKLEQASSAIAKLPDPALCADPARLATVVPVDAMHRAQADQIETEIASLRARWLLGERGDTLQAARELADRGERLAAAPVALVTSGLLADMLGDRGDLTEATDAHLTAARHAARARDDRTLALRLIRAAETSAMNLAFERAAALLSSAEIVANRLGDRSLQDDLDAAIAELALKRGEPTKAVALSRPLVERLRARQGRTSLDTLNASYQLARGHLDAKQLDESEQVARTVIADIATSFGPDHPDAVPFYNHLGGIAAARNRWDDAYQAFERALAITRAAYGEDSPLAADALNNLAMTRIEQGRAAEAVEPAKQAIALGERSQSRKLHVYLSQLAVAHLEMGNAKEGVPLLERSLALREELYGATSPQLLKPLLGLGLASANANDLDRARTHWRRAVAILQQMPEPPAFGIDLMRDLASIETGRAKTTLLGDADALERRLAARTKLASKP